MQAFETLWNEYVQTGQNLRLLCGAEVIETLIRRLEITVRRLHIVRNLVFVDQLGGYRQFRNDSKVWPFLLHTCSWSNVSDPRDKVYGVLGLFSTSLLEVDYLLDARAVYASSTFRMIKHMGNLALLSQATSSVSLANGLPSWVPDWRVPTTSTAPFLVFYDLFDAGRKNLLDVQVATSDTLCLKAAMIDEIEECASEYDHHACTRSEDLPKVLRPVMIEWLKFAAVPLLTDQSFLSQFTISVSGRPSQDDRPKSISFDRAQLAVQQSQRAPFYHDADYTTEGVSYREPQVQVPQGAKAPFYRDRDYNTQRDVYAATESQNAPLYKRSDSRPSKHDGISLKRKAEESIPTVLQSSSAPLYRHASSNTTGGTKSNDIWKFTYRAYDSFTHTYVDSGSFAKNLPSKNSPSEVLQATDFGATYLTGETSSEVFWRTLCMDVVEC